MLGEERAVSALCDVNVVQTKGVLVFGIDLVHLDG